MKRILSGLLLVFVITIAVNAQPYVFYSTDISDTSLFQDMSTIWRLDLSTGTKETFIDTLSQIYILGWDSKQEWMYVTYYKNPAEIYNLKTLEVKEIPEKLSGLYGGFIYSDLNNKIYFFSDIWDNKAQFSSLDLTNDNFNSLLIVPNNGLMGNILNEEAFLSHNQEIIYFVLEDTLHTPRHLNEDKIIYFSTITNNIIKTNSLSAFGYPGCDAYKLHKGRNGKAIVQSYKNKLSYLRVYDFDNDTGSSYISYEGAISPYFTDKGEYVILAALEVNSGSLNYPGKFFIYSTITSTLLRTISLPEGGEIYTFDNYPDDLYYVVDIDSPKRQIFHINADSLLNR